MSTTTLSNETNSVFSNMTTGKKMIKANNNKKNEEMHVDKKCKEIIEKAKAEWNFTNKEIENMLVKKIMKNYYQIRNIIHQIIPNCIQIVSHQLQMHQKIL